MNIVIDSHIPFVQGVFEPFGQVRYLPPQQITHEAIQHADALLIRTRTRCDAQLLDHTNVRFIATATIGYDHIDADYCRQHGITWTNAAGCNAAAVQQYIEAALLYFARTTKQSLAGLTLGIVGVGHVGKLVEQKAKELNINTLLCDPPRQRTENSSCFVPLEQLAQQADIITFHTPLTQNGPDRTFHMCDAHLLQQATQLRLLINAARGGIVDEQALNGTSAQLVLDCWEHEPAINRSLLQRTLLGTPHIAGYSLQGKANASTMSVQAIGQHFGLPLEKWIAAIPTQTPHTYNIEADSLLLKQKPDNFEQLRSDYRLR